MLKGSERSFAKSTQPTFPSSDVLMPSKIKVQFSGRSEHTHKWNFPPWKAAIISAAWLWLVQMVRVADVTALVMEQTFREQPQKPHASFQSFTFAVSKLFLCPIYCFSTKLAAQRETQASPREDSHKLLRFLTCETTENTLQLPLYIYIYIYILF